MAIDVRRQGWLTVLMTNTNTPNVHFTFEDYDQAKRQHDREAAAILSQLIGALRFMESPEGRNDEAFKARTLDVYADLVRSWDGDRPEWVR